MQYFAVVWQAFLAAFSWFWSFVTADDVLYSIFTTVVFAWIVVNLFLAPFFQGAMLGAGHDSMRRLRDGKPKPYSGKLRSRIPNDHQKHLPGSTNGSVSGNGFPMR